MAGPVASVAMDEHHLLDAVRYVLLNPLRAGLVEALQIGPGRALPHIWPAATIGWSRWRRYVPCSATLSVLSGANRIDMATRIPAAQAGRDDRPAARLPRLDRATGAAIRAHAGAAQARSEAAGHDGSAALAASAVAPDGTDVPISGLLREGATGDTAMKIIYEIIEHDGGWAYKVGPPTPRRSIRATMRWLPPGSPPPNSRWPVRPKASNTRTPPASGTTRWPRGPTARKPTSPRNSPARLPSPA